MTAPTEEGSWTKELGSVWFLCLFAGFMMGGVGLFLTIPIAIVLTIKAIWEDSKPRTDQHSVSAHYLPYRGGIQELDTMEIPHSGYSASERAAEYRRRGQSPSGVIDGVYNDMNRPSGVPYSDTNRDWDADA